jgi:hypothetical protein
MTNRYTLLVAAALSLGVLATRSSPAMAGDPCPVRIAVVDLGVPDWASPELKQRARSGDALLARLIKLAGGLECTEVEAAPLQAGKIALKTYEPIDPADLSVDRIKARLVDDKRRFRCDHTARELKQLTEAFGHDGLLLFYRGHSRILLVSPGWKSVCVASARADKMSDKQLVALWTDVNGPMIKNRHDNP